MKSFLGFLLMLPIIELFYYILYKVFDLLKLKRLALFCFALSDALFCGCNSKKIKEYCVKNDLNKNKKCSKCLYWTCSNCKKEVEK